METTQSNHDFDVIYKSASSAHIKAAQDDFVKNAVADLKSSMIGRALTYDDNKQPLANLPPEGIRAVARVQAYGHSKK